MNAFKLRTAMLVAGLALAAGPALAQKAGAGGGGNGGNGGGGNAGGGGGATAGSSNVAGSSSGSTSTTSTASSGFSSPSASGPSASYRGGGGAMMRTAAPEHRTSFDYSSNQNNQHATPTATAAPRASSSPRTGSNASSGPRTGSNASSSQPRADASQATPRASGSTTRAATNNPAGNREVPSWSRNRGGRPSTGTAVPRTPDNPAPGSAAYYQYYLSRYGYYNPYFYDPSGVYGYYGFGGGYYGFYNPYYSPYGFGGYGLDPGFGYPYYGDPNDPYMYGDGYGSYSSRVYSGEGNGALKLKVKPKDAKVYVDGYFAGLADQKLTLNGGNHKVEVKADGYETSEFDVLITPGKTLTFAGDLKKLQ